MRTGLVLVAGIVLAGPALAQGLEAGWRVQFYRDTFQDQVFPIALAQESAEEVSPAALGFVCMGSGKIAATFSASGMSSMQDAVSVAFRLPSGLRNFRFTAQNVPNFGGRRIADDEESQALVEVASNASGPIPFRTGQKQGLIPVSGAKQAIAMLKSNCVGS